jgi:hypothetical protein
MLNRESLDARRADGAAAALSHLLIVVEHVDHRAGVGPSNVERSVGASVGVDEGKDVVSCTS